MPLSLFDGKSFWRFRCITYFFLKLSTQCLYSKPLFSLYSDKPSQNGRNFRVKGKAFGYLEFIATVDLDDLFIVSKE